MGGTRLTAVRHRRAYSRALVGRPIQARAQPEGIRPRPGVQCGRRAGRVSDDRLGVGQHGYGVVGVPRRQALADPISFCLWLVPLAGGRLTRPPAFLEAMPVSSWKQDPAPARGRKITWSIS